MDASARTPDHASAEEAREIVRRMHTEAEEVKQREVEQALNRLQIEDREAEQVIRETADSLVARLLSHPTERTMAAAYEGDLDTVRTARELFEEGGMEL